MRRVVAATLKLSKHERTEYTVMTEVGTTREELLAPEFLASIAESLRPGDIICVMPEDYSFEAVLFVRAAQKNAARVVLREFYNYDEAESNGKIPDGYIAEWSGPHTKWRIKRVSDKAVIESGFPDQPSAIAKIKFIVGDKKAA